MLDDEPDITTIIEKALENRGYAVDIFNDPELALKSYQKGKYDMIISDIRMPNINGFDFYREIRRIDDKAKIAFMTSFEIYKDEFQKLFPNTDVRCFIQKPIRMNDLVSRIDEELAIHVR